MAHGHEKAAGFVSAHRALPLPYQPLASPMAFDARTDPWIKSLRDLIHSNPHTGGEIDALLEICAAHKGRSDWSDISYDLGVVPALVRTLTPKLHGNAHCVFVSDS